MKKAKTSKTKRIHYLFILDESGSMAALREETINAVNTQLEEIKKASRKNDIETLATVLCFDSGNGTRYNFLCKNHNVGKVAVITKEQYKPNGMTPLFDAIGKGIDTVLSYLEAGSDDEKVLVNIFTDGQENSSKEYSHAAITQRIKELSKDGKWLFTFIGCGDITAVKQFSVSIGIDFSNVANYDGTKAGFQNVMRGMSCATTAFYASTAAGLDNSKDFFGKAKDETK